MFNKKLEQRVKKLEEEAIKTHELINKAFEELKSPKCFGFEDAVPENTYINHFGKYIWALKDYLGIEFKEEMVEDERFDKPQPKMRKILRAIKIKVFPLKKSAKKLTSKNY